MPGLRHAAATGRAQEKEREAGGGVPEPLVMVLNPTSAAAEAYRLLRTNLLYAFIDDPPKVIVVTSPGPREGKSTTCANLGVALAQGNNRTLLLDCDLRKPVLHKIFGLRNFRGIVSVLAGEQEMQGVLQEPLPGLNVLTAGPLPLNPAELLDSRRFAEFLQRVRSEFEYVLIDAPPVELVSDPVILAAQTDGVLLVLDAQNTRKAAVRRSMRALQAVGANVIGTVMNNLKPSKGARYGYEGYVQE